MKETNNLAAQMPNRDEQELQEMTLMRNSMALYSTIFVIATGLIFGFYFSHRFAGPIYKTIQYLRSYQKGQHLGKLSFRTGDFFHELADEVNNSLQEENKSVPD